MLAIHVDGANSDSNMFTYLYEFDLLSYLVLPGWLSWAAFRTISVVKKNK